MRRRWRAFIVLCLLWVVSVIAAILISHWDHATDWGEALYAMIIYGVGGIGLLMLIEYAVLAALF
jgi:hypothetical protein